MVHLHPDYETFVQETQVRRLFTVSTHNRSLYTRPAYRAGDAFLFGPETRGLPSDLRRSVPAPQRITLPMVKDSRSLNLANCVGIVVYEAWRQIGFRR